MHKNSRFAGARLGAGSIEDVTTELKQALTALNESRDNVRGFERRLEVPGTDEHVYLHASPEHLPSIPEDVDGFKVLGNRDQVQLLSELKSPGVVSLSWDTSANYMDDPGVKLRVGRTADRGWKQAIKELPENTIVTNTPVGGMAGDFERADLYTRRGFGPLQTDGTQYGIIQNGSIQPLSPFVPDENHLRHLADRAYEAGDLETNDQIRRALNERRKSNIDQQLKEAQESKRYRGRDDYSDYDDYGYDDYDYDDEGYPPTRPPTREDVKSQLDNYLSGNYNGNGELGQGQSPEIELRRIAQPPYGQSNYEPTPEDIEDFRRLQVDALQIPSGARHQLDVINNYSPRPLPRRITVEDLTQDRIGFPYSLYSQPFDPVNSDSSAVRRQQIIDALRANQSGVSATGYDHDPSAVRHMIKQVATTTRTNPEPGALGIIRQEHYSPEDVEALRNWQAAQAQNWPVETPFRQPPPTLNPDGTVASRRPAPEEAFDSSVHLRDLPGRDPIIRGTTVLNRRMLTPEQEAAAEELARLQRTPASIERDFNQLEHWFDDSRGGGRVFRELVEANTEEELTAGHRGRPLTSDRLQRDMRILHRGVAQPGSVSADSLGRAVANLRTLQASGYGDLGRHMQGLQDQLSAANYGPPAPHREFNTAEPEPPSDVLGDLFSGRSATPVPGADPWESQTPAPRRRAPRRPQVFEDRSNSPYRPTPRYQQKVKPVDASDTFARPTGERAIRPEAFRLRGPSPEELDRIERLLEGY